MLNALPILGWILSITFAISLSVPFWFFWTVCKIGEKYFYFVPDVYQGIGFWNCVALFTVISILKAVLIPKFSSNSQTNNNKK